MAKKIIIFVWQAVINKDSWNKIAQQSESYTISCTRSVNTLIRSLDKNSIVPDRIVLMDCALTGTVDDHVAHKGSQDDRVDALKKLNNFMQERGLDDTEIILAGLRDNPTGLYEPFNAIIDTGLTTPAFIESITFPVVKSFIGDDLATVKARFYTNDLAAVQEKLGMGGKKSSLLGKLQKKFGRTTGDTEDKEDTETKDEAPKPSSVVVEGGVPPLIPPSVSEDPTPTASPTTSPAAVPSDMFDFSDAGAAHVQTGILDMDDEEEKEEEDSTPAPVTPPSEALTLEAVDPPPEASTPEAAVATPQPPAYLRDDPQPEPAEEGISSPSGTVVSKPDIRDRVVVFTGSGAVYESLMFANHSSQFGRVLYLNLDFNNIEVTYYLDDRSAFFESGDHSISGTPYTEDGIDFISPIPGTVQNIEEWAEWAQAPSNYLDYSRIVVCCPLGSLGALGSLLGHCQVVCILHDKPELLGTWLLTMEDTSIISNKTARNLDNMISYSPTVTDDFLEELSYLKETSLLTRVDWLGTVLTK